MRLTHAVVGSARGVMGSVVVLGPFLRLWKCCSSVKERSHSSMTLLKLAKAVGGEGWPEGGPGDGPIDGLAIAHTADEPRGCEGLGHVC